MEDWTFSQLPLDEDSMVLTNYSLFDLMDPLFQIKRLYTHTHPFFFRSLFSRFLSLVTTRGNMGYKKKLIVGNRSGLF